LFAAWQPLPATVWQATDPRAVAAIRSVSALGWLIVFGTFLTGHFKLLERQQKLLNFAGRVTSAVAFKAPGLYRFVRHPLYLGFILAFWATPSMTAGHLLFVVVTTLYIFVGIALEERDLVDLFGDEYRQYKQSVSMLISWRWSV